MLTSFNHHGQSPNLSLLDTSGYNSPLRYQTKLQESNSSPAPRKAASFSIQSFGKYFIAKPRKLKVSVSPETSLPLLPRKQEPSSTHNRREYDIVDHLKYLTGSRSQLLLLKTKIQQDSTQRFNSIANSQLDVKSSVQDNFTYWKAQALLTRMHQSVLHVEPEQRQSMASHLARHSTRLRRVGQSVLFGNKFQKLRQKDTVIADPQERQQIDRWRRQFRDFLANVAYVRKSFKNYIRILLTLKGLSPEIKSLLFLRVGKETLIKPMLDEETLMSEFMKKAGQIGSDEQNEYIKKFTYYCTSLQRFIEQKLEDITQLRLKQREGMRNEIASKLMRYHESKQTGEIEHLMQPPKSHVPMVNIRKTIDLLRGQQQSIKLTQMDLLENSTLDLANM